MLLDGAPVTSLAEYVERGGGTGWQLAIDADADRVLDELERSGLRGRGGAGFSTATKWRSIVAGGDAVGERFVVANGAEGEPGTFKDRTLLRHNPYLLLEGLLIAARIVGAQRTFVALKSSFEIEADAVASAAAEIAAAGWADDIQIDLVRGPDEYLFGEEKALLEVIEGEEPLPRLFPPYLYGLFTTSPQIGWSAGRTLPGERRDAANPTLVNNVETLSTIPAIVANGGDWYRRHGTPESPGTMICTVSGDTLRHGVGEYELGTPLVTVIAELGGGMPRGRAIKYVLSGISNPVLPGELIDTPLTYEDMEAAGAGLGTGGFIVYDDRTDPAELAHAVSTFLGVESCGQCSACKLGCQQVTDILAGLDGVTEGAIYGDLRARLASVTDASRCFLPSQEQRVVASLLPDMHDPRARRPPRGIEITKIVGIDDGRFLLDPTQARKRPDWTYEPD
jgi:NADH:ubiquinone oxidoreductase subunit F (NADH-binding)